MLESFLSCCPCPGFQNLAWSQMSHARLWRETFLGAFFSSVPAVSLLLYHDLLLSSLHFSLHLKKKKNQVTKQFSLRVKVLQIQACYLYSILMNNSPTLMPCVWLTCNYGLYFFTVTLNGILPWLFLKPSLEPLGHKRKGGLYRFHPVIVVFLPKA